MAPSGRIELGISPVDPTVLYASSEGGLSGNEADLYISRDSGENWILLLEENNGDNFDFLIQGNYDNVVLPHPFDKNKLPDPEEKLAMALGINFSPNILFTNIEAFASNTIGVDLLEENERFHIPGVAGDLVALI